MNRKDDNDRVNTYLKNCCVALISAKKNNCDCDVALVTNIIVPEKYRNVLLKNQIQIIEVEFNKFNFNNDYTWALAFYKLCAIEYIVNNFSYKYYSYLDSDVYVQSSFDNIWKECDYSIMLYDINHGLQVEHYRHFMSEIASFSGSDKLITLYGGEFFAANRENAKAFIDCCDKIYKEMLATDFITTHGDEFIVSLAAQEFREKIKNAGAYVFRFWTSAFRLVSTCYINNPVTVLHVPDEKERGMLKIFEKYIIKGVCPSKAVVYKRFRFKKPNLKIKIRMLLKTVLKKW